MDQFNSHSKSTVFWPSMFLVHFILFRIHEIGKEKKRLEMSSFEECSTIYSWFFSTYMYMYLPLSSRERRLGRRPAVHVLQTRLRRFSPGEKHVDKNFSCASFNKDIANWENRLSPRKRLAFRDCRDGFRQDDAWGRRAESIRWHVTIQIWVVLFFDRLKQIFNQSEALPSSG